MRNKLTIFLVTLLLMFSLTGCDESTNTPTTEIPVSTESTQIKASSFINTEENVVLEYTSDHSPVYNQSYFNSFVEGNRVQRKIFLPSYGTETDEVLELTDDKVVLVYGDAYPRYHENIVSEEFDPNEEMLILEGPFEVGKQWQLLPNTTSEITSMTAPITTEAGDFVTMEVKTVYENGNYCIENYAENIGIVKRIFYTPEKGESIQTLKSIKKDTPIQLEMKLFMYDASEDIVDASEKDYYYYETYNYDLKTNEGYLEPLKQALLADPKELGSTISEESDLVSVTINREEDSLTLDMASNFQQWVTQNNGSGAEEFALRKLVDTVGNYYDVSNVNIMVAGQPYTSGHTGTIENPQKVTLIK